MKTLYFHPIILLLFAFSGLGAQNQVAGSLRDGAGKPLAFATVTLLNAADSSLVRGDFTTEQGVYQFENLASGTYLLGYSMLGFEQSFSKKFVLTGTPSKLDMEPVDLKPSAALLGEVEVVAKRPFLEQKIDRTVVNVANSITNAGGTALQVLQRSPGVQVNALTKSISLAGKEGVVVMINNKISRLPAEAVVDMLSGMNADNIDRIELIHTPPAGFEAEGNAGIIHIVLKNTGDQGLNGGYSGKIGYGKGLKYGAGLYFNYRKNKVNLFGSYDLDYDLNPQVFTNYRRIRQGLSIFETASYSDRPHTPTTTQNARLGLDFQVSKKTVIGVLGTFFDRNWYMEAVNDVTYSKNGQVDSLLRMPNTETNHNRSFSGNINLSHQFTPNQSMNVDLDFVNYDIENPSYYDVQSLDATGNPVSNRELRLSKTTPIKIGVVKIDYAAAIGKNTRLETGVKLTAMRFDNDVRVEERPGNQDWQVVSEYTSLSHLNENIAGAYASFSTKLNKKTALKAGLRYEYTDSKLDSGAQVIIVDREYGSLFPSVFISRTISENQSLNLSYSRRITRPAIRRLAPWLIFDDPTTLEGGNPALQPSFTNALNLQYAIKTWKISISYSIEDDPIRYIPKVDIPNNRQFNYYENLGNQKVINANLYVPFHPAKWWDMSTNLYTNVTQINYDLEGELVQLRNINYGFNTTQTFKMPKQFTLEVSGNYDSPSYWGVAYWKATGSLNIGLEKNFGEKWGKLRFNATNLLLSDNWFGTTDQPEIDLLVKSSFQMAERTFMLSWNNTFGNKKLKSARERQTGGMEELRRI